MQVDLQKAPVPHVNLKSGGQSMLDPLLGEKGCKVRRKEKLSCRASDGTYERKKSEKPELGMIVGEAGALMKPYTEMCQAEVGQEGEFLQIQFESREHEKERHEMMELKRWAFKALLGLMVRRNAEVSPLEAVAQVRLEETLL